MSTPVSPVDPHDVIMTGENSFIRLSHDGGKTLSDRISHWRVLWCPAGAGNVLFAHTQLFDGQVRIFSDNVAVARWLQRTIETFLYPLFADLSTPIASAEFGRSGDPRSTCSETVTAPGQRIVLSWYDCLDPFVLTLPVGFNNRPLGVYSTFFPARSAQIEVNGRVSTGSAWHEVRGDRPASSACLAWSETWVKPRAE